MPRKNLTGEMKASLNGKNAVGEALAYAITRVYTHMGMYVCMYISCIHTYVLGRGNVTSKINRMYVECVYTKLWTRLVQQ